MIAKLFALVATVREVVALGDRILSMYEKWQDGRIDRHYDSKQKRRERLLKQIEKETNDDKLRDLHRKLRNLDSDKL